MSLSVFGSSCQTAHAIGPLIAFGKRSPRLLSPREPRPFVGRRRRYGCEDTNPRVAASHCHDMIEAGRGPPKNPPSFASPPSPTFLSAQGGRPGLACQSRSTMNPTRCNDVKKEFLGSFQSPVVAKSRSALLPEFPLRSVAVTTKRYPISGERQSRRRVWFNAKSSSDL